MHSIITRRDWEVRFVEWKHKAEENKQVYMTVHPVDSQYQPMVITEGDEGKGL